MLLEKIVNELPASHDDRKGLQKAKDIMVDVAQYVEALNKDSEHLNIIRKVQNSIVDLELPKGHELSKCGRLLFGGDLTFRVDNKDIKSRYAFIFEKIMILVKIQVENSVEKKYSFREVYDFNDYHVDNEPSRNTGYFDRYKFPLKIKKKLEGTAFTLFLKTEVEREKCMQAIIKAIETLEPLGCKVTDHKLIITTFEKPTDCHHCKKYLKGLVLQGYKCRICKIGVHKACISSSGRCLTQNSEKDVNFSKYNWYVGLMDKDTATANLKSKRVGTFLLRSRPPKSFTNETKFALGVK